MQNSKPINKEKSESLSRLFNYSFSEGAKVVRISWFISEGIIYLTEKDVDEFCKNHELLYLDKNISNENDYEHEIFVYGKKSGLSEDEIIVLKSALKKYSEDNGDFKWDEYFKDWKIDMRKRKFKYC